MRFATFTVQNASPFSSKHNLRLEIPTYLIDISANNEYLTLHTDKEFKKKAIEKYLKTKKQKMQERQKIALIKEVVLTLKQEHTIKDVILVFRELNLKYGGHYPLEICIHRDEGHYVKDEIPYSVSKNIFYKHNNWYRIPLKMYLDSSYEEVEEDATELVDISKYTRVYNYHAHIKFSMFDLESGLTGRMKKHQAGAERLKMVAQILGLKYKKSIKKKQRIPVSYIKNIHNLGRIEKIKLKYLHDYISKSTLKQTQSISDMQHKIAKKQEVIDFINKAIQSVLPYESSKIQPREKILCLTSKYSEGFENIKQLTIDLNNYKSSSIIDKKKIGRLKEENSNVIQKLINLQQENKLLKEIIYQKDALEANSQNDNFEEQVDDISIFPKV